MRTGLCWEEEVVRQFGHVSCQSYHFFAKLRVGRVEKSGVCTL